MSFPTILPRDAELDKACRAARTLHLAQGSREDIDHAQHPDRTSGSDHIMGEVHSPHECILFMRKKMDSVAIIDTSASSPMKRSDRNRAD